MSQYDFDLFVFGAGSGGVRASRMAAATGAKVAVAEDRYLGGTCVNVGCVPKKLFVYASHLPEEMHDAQRYGWTSQAPRFDWATLRDNKNQEIQRLNGIYEGLLSNAGVTLFEGTATLIDAHTVQVGDQQYSAKNILIATGGWPFVPSFPGSEHVITSNEVFHLESFPKRAMVVGGGYIAVEFAGIFKGLGVDTQLHYRGPMFLRNFDDDVRNFVKQELDKKGIDLQFNSNIASVEKQTDGTLLALMEDGSRIETDLILYATGRKPLVEGLGFAEAGLEMASNGAIKVDEYYQTNIENIYAIGDVIDKVQLTPVALAEGMAVVKTLFHNTPSTVDYSNIATAVFCQPNIGTVGLTEAQALEQYQNVDVYQSAFRALKHTISGSDEQTMMKMIVDKASDKVVGVHMVGPDAGEMMQGIAVALKCGATKAQFDATIGIHPTAAEEFVTMREPKAS